MAINWNQVNENVAAAIVVAYFAATGSLMTRVITQVAISPKIGAISGAIFGVLCLLQHEKNMRGIFHLMFVNTVATLPLACYNYPGNNQAIFAASVGLTALHIANRVAISILF